MTLLFVGAREQRRHSPVAKVEVACVLLLSLCIADVLLICNPAWYPMPDAWCLRIRILHSQPYTRDPTHRPVEARTPHVSLICWHDYDFVAKPGGSWRCRCNCDAAAASKWMALWPIPDVRPMCESCSQRLWKMLPMDFDPVQITCELRSPENVDKRFHFFLPYSIV